MFQIIMPFVDLFCRHCKANLNVEIIIYDNLALQFNFARDILKEPAYKLHWKVINWLIYLKYKWIKLV